MEDINEKGLYKRAKERVGEIKEFYFNLMCFCIVIPILVFINIVNNPGYYWCLYAVLGWSIGLLIHGIYAFDKIPFIRQDWEERKIRELMEKEKSGKIGTNGSYE